MIQNIESSMPIIKRKIKYILNLLYPTFLGNAIGKVCSSTWKNWNIELSTLN